MDASLVDAVPETVLDIGRRLGAQGFDAVLVGGAVRDALLGAEPVDWDLVTSASTPDQRAIASAATGVRSVYGLGERFGTLGIALENGGTLEVSRYRPDALAAATLAERFAIDAGHRDFTANAVGLDLGTGELLDPLAARADLSTRMLRAPGDPSERFAEDPLRVIRAARFVAELGFELEPTTAAAMRGPVRGLERIAVERIRDELTKLLVAPGASNGLDVLRECGALAVVLPEVAALDGVTQPTFHDLDVLAHTIQAVGLAPRERVLRWATLLHDVGKAPARSIDPDGRIRFMRHAQLGAAIARDICARLRFSAADTRAIVHLVEEHMRLGDVNLESPRSVDRAVRKLDLHAEDAASTLLVTAEDAVELTLADLGATAHRDDASRLRRLLEGVIAGSRERGTHVPVAVPISGRDIMREFGLAEEPRVGIAKRAVRDAIEKGELDPGDVRGAIEIAGEALGLTPSHDGDPDG